MFRIKSFQKMIVFIHLENKHDYLFCEVGKQDNFVRVPLYLPQTIKNNSLT